MGDNGSADQVAAGVNVITFRFVMKASTPTRLGYNTLVDYDGGAS